MHEVSKEIFKQTPLLDSIDSLVLDYLIRQGHNSTFSSLPFKTSSLNTTTLLYRSQVIKLIKHGKILEALNLIQTNFLSIKNGTVNGGHKPEKLSKLTTSKALSINKLLSIKQITFLLNLQQFIELLRVRNTIQAVTWVQLELLHLTQGDSDLKAILDEALGVLVYTQPEQSPMAWIFEQKHRYSALASLTNSALLSISPDLLLTDETTSASSPIETFLKHVKTLDNLVHDLNGFSNELDDRKWSNLHSLIDLDNQNGRQRQCNFIKIIKNE